MVTEERHIAHLDLDSFYVSVELLRNPHLKGKPVLIGGDSVRGVVASCSYEARSYGIHSAMPMKTAKQLCPHAIVIPADMEAYARHSAMVTEIIKQNVPLFEKSSIDEFYIDLTGMERYFGCMNFMRSLIEKIKTETGLPISFALSSNKLVSKIATNEVKPNGAIEIPFGEERSFLAPLDVKKMPGVGKKMLEKLHSLGIKTIKDVSEMPIETLKKTLGKTGAELWYRSRGMDDSPVVPFHEQRSISKESTFQIDIKNVENLHGIIVRMTEKIAFEMRSKKLKTSCVGIKLRYQNFETFTKQKTIPYTNSDEILIRTAAELFTQLYDKRLAVRLLGVRLTQFIPDSAQATLFDTIDETSKLYNAIDNIKNRFGEDLLTKAGGLKKKH